VDLTADFVTLGLAAAAFTFAAAALCAKAASLPGGKLGKLDLGFATVLGSSDGLRPFFFSIAEYVSNLFNKFTMFGPVATNPGG
jgi:hypothetical protein